MERLYGNICLICNIGSHYRYPIYNLMGKELNCDFYLGNQAENDIKTFDYRKLEGYKKTLRNSYCGHIYWQHGVLDLAFKNYDSYIITAEPYCLSTWFFLFVTRLRRKNVLGWTHGWYGRENLFKRIIKKTFFSMFSRLLVYGEYAINLMIKEGFHKEKLFCIANSLDSDKDKELRSELKETDIYKKHFNNPYPTIIYCGRVQKVKRLDMIVDSLKILKNRGAIVNFVIVGQDVDSVDIEDYSHKCGVANQIWMYGPCYDDVKLGELFYNAAVCVSPGNVGLTAIHSLSFGCPVITHDNFHEQMPEFEAIKPGRTGDFYQYGSIDDLANKILEWCRKKENNKDNVRKAAFEEIDSKWNIHYQLDILKNALQ